MTDDDSRLLPFRPSVRATEPDRLVVGLTDEDGTALFETLSSEMARSILARLHAAPATPPELATALDCSRQVVHYHLSNLESTGLITPVDTGYSEKGVEMTIYAPTADPLVVKHAPDEHDPGRWLSRSTLVGLTGLLAVVGLFVVASRLLVSPIAVDGPSGESGRLPENAPVATDTAVNGTPTTTPTISSTPPPDITTTTAQLPPELLVGCVIVVIAVGWWYHG